MTTTTIPICPRPPIVILLWVSKFVWIEMKFDIVNNYFKIYFEEKNENVMIIITQPSSFIIYPPFTLHHLVQSWCVSWSLTQKYTFML